MATRLSSRSVITALAAPTSQKDPGYKACVTGLRRSMAGSRFAVQLAPGRASPPVCRCACARRWPARAMMSTMPPNAEPNDRGTPTRVVLADDSVLLREGIARLLEDGGFEVVGQSGNADDLMMKVHSYKPDVAIV